jgi:molecular chaperone DnaK (HSP70)
VSGHVGIDFGTTTTIVAVVDPVDGTATSIALPPLTRSVHHDDNEAQQIPSLIHFDGSGGSVLGRAVEDRNLTDSQATFRWMKPTIVEQLYDNPRSVGGRTITHRQAAEEFFAAVFTQLFRAGFEQSRVCFTVPVHSFEEYVDWLSDVATRNGFNDVTFVDEASAAGIGYDIGLSVGDRFLLFDFGGGTLDVAVIELLEPSGVATQRIRVLGKSGTGLGGRSIDRWIVEWAKTQSGLGDGALQRLANELLVSAERAKISLSNKPTATVDAIDPLTGKVITLDLGERDFEQLLDDNRMFDIIEETLRAALNQAKDHAVSDTELTGILLVGGSSLIPAVRRHLSRRFGADRVHLHKPIDAVAIGAARIATGAQVDNRLYHEYQLRYRDNGRDEYQPIVTAGSAHPTDDWLETYFVTSATSHQTQFNLEIYETDVTRVGSPGCEIFFDADGSARFAESSADAETWRRHICSETINAKASTAPWEECIELRFRVDDSRRLRINATDMRNGKVIHKDLPVTRLR